MRKNKLINLFLIVFILANGMYLIHKKRKKHDFGDTVKISKIQDRFIHLENWKDSILLSDLAKERPVLILRLPRVSCQQCKYAELENMNSLFRKDTICRGCALITTYTSRDLLSLKFSFNYDFLKTGSFDENILNIAQEEFKKPYYFVLTPDLQANMIFFPNPNNPRETDRYFEKIVNKYFKKYQNE